MKLFKNLLLGAGLALATGTALSAQELGQLHYRAEAGLAISRISALGVHHNGDTGKYLTSFRAGGESRDAFRQHDLLLHSRALRSRSW